MPKVIGITGYAQNGKNSVAEAIRAHYEPGDVEIIGFADALRQMAIRIDPIIGQEPIGTLIHYAPAVAKHGYEYVKGEFREARRFLQRLGTEGVREVLGDDVWIRALDDKVERSSAKIVAVADCRFENEVAYIKSKGELWAVRRMDFKSGIGTTHPSEAYIRTAMLQADVTFENKGTVEDLFAAVDGWLSFQLKSKGAIV